jgi:hypothetical protein
MEAKSNSRNAVRPTHIGVIPLWMSCVFVSFFVIIGCEFAPSQQASATQAPNAASNEPNPAVTGPITGGLHGRPWMGTPFNVADYGYSEQEYFYSGTAKAYGVNGPPANYETRMLVYRPTDPAKFSGNVIVEWDNVTAQFDIPFDFIWTFPQVLANGDAYVEISAQQAGICGAELTGQHALSIERATIGDLSLDHISSAVCTPVSLKGWDSERYAPLVDPGDEYSYDIYSQGAEAILHPEGISPLGDLHIKKIIAIGESQSALELDDYITYGADGAAKVFDGFIMDADTHNTSVPASYRVPVLKVWGEESAQPVNSTSGRNNVIWQVAGAPHVDHEGVSTMLQWAESDLLSEPPISVQQEEDFQQANGNYGQEGPSLSATCAGDTEFPRRYVMDAALTDMETWVETGVPAPSAPPLVFTGLAQATQEPSDVGFNSLLPVQYVNFAAFGVSPLALVRDADANAIGGLRLPVMNVPVATYFGPTCLLLGTSIPFLPTVLHQLYPSHAAYVAKIVAATQAAVHERYMTLSDGFDLLQRACASAIPNWGTTPESQQPALCMKIDAVSAYP